MKTIVMLYFVQEDHGTIIKTKAQKNNFCYFEKIRDAQFRLSDAIFLAIRHRYKLSWQHCLFVYFLLKWRRKRK